MNRLPTIFTRTYGNLLSQRILSSGSTVNLSSSSSINNNIHQSVVNIFPTLLSSRGSIITTFSNNQSIIKNYYNHRNYSTNNDLSKDKIIDHTLNIPSEGNIPSTILEKRGKSLHNQFNHPLNIIKKKIQYHFQQQSIKEQQQQQQQQDSNSNNIIFKFYDEFDSKVTVKQNFEDLLIGKDHVGRSPNDTYYFSKNDLLRTHTSAHQTQLLKQGDNAFLVTGDVYRRDTIDSVHYPVFHQMEGVRILKEHLPPLYKPNGIDYYTDQEYRSHPSIKKVEQHLKSTLESMVNQVIGGSSESKLNIRWIDAHFPFTAPSWEMEIEFQGKWLEVLGCGVIHPKIMNDTGRGMEAGWAFGIGLERLAMILFEIPDIRLFWTMDDRFHRQFLGLDKNNSKQDHIQSDINIKGFKYQVFSKYPSCFKDITFWLPTNGSFHENSLYEFLRSEAGDLIEDVSLIDNFTHPKTGKTSHCYRINYRSMDRNLTNEEIDQIQSSIRSKIKDKLNVELR